MIYLKSGESNTTYFLSTQFMVHHKLCLRRAFGVPVFETFIITPCGEYGWYDYANCYCQIISQTYYLDTIPFSIKIYVIAHKNIREDFR